MVGIGVSGASAGSDVLSLAKSSSRSKSSSSDSSGFSNALSNSGSGNDSSAGSKNTTSSKNDGSKPQGSSQAASSTVAAPAKTAKPATTMTAQEAAQAFAEAMAEAPEDETAATADTPAAADTQTVSADDLAKQLAAMVAGETPTPPVTDAKGNSSTTKTDKSETTKDDDADSADSTANVAVTDALSLLNVAAPGVTTPAQTSTSVLAAAGQLHAGNGKVVPDTDGKVADISADSSADSADDTVATGMAALASRSLGKSDADAGSATDDDGSVPNFQVARGNSKVQALDLAEGKHAEESARIDLKSAEGDGTANVTVLESRRVVGLAAGTNSALVANAMTGNKDWAAAMQSTSSLTGASAVTSPSKVMNSLKIQMTPENLGTVTATMRLSGDQLSVDLKVQSSEAYRQLSNDQSAIIDSLRQQGYSVDRVTVTYSSPDTSGNSQSGSQSQQQQQSGASQGQQGGEAQTRKQNSGRQAGDQDGIWGTGNVGTDGTVAGGSQRAGAGGVYL